MCSPQLVHLPYFFLTWVNNFDALWACLFESAYPEPIFRDSSSLNMNAPSDKEYFSIIPLFWSLGNYTVYWYESDTFSLFFIMIIVLLSMAIREDLFLPNGKKNVWSYFSPLTWQHSHLILNVVDTSNIIFFPSWYKLSLVPCSFFIPPYHPVSEILSRHNSYAYYKTFNARFLY